MNKSEGDRSLTGRRALWTGIMCYIDGNVFPIESPKSFCANSEQFLSNTEQFFF